MSQPHSRRRIPAVLLAGVVAMLSAASSAWAFVISSTPTLPVLGVAYIASNGAGCFPIAGVCIAAGTFTPTSLVSSDFTGGNQEIVMNVSYQGALTNLSNVPIGMINLSGTMEQEVTGRSSANEIGSWATELVALSLSGSVLGGTLTLTLDPLHTSAGSTSIVPFADDERLFVISSFFDVFVDLNLDGPQRLHTTRGPIHASLAPEPSSLALLVGGLAAVASRRRRKAARS